MCQRKSTSGLRIWANQDSSGTTKEQILADCRAEIQKHEFQADYDRRSIPKLKGVIESQRGEINRALAGDEQLRRDQQLLHEQLLEQNRELREVHVKSLNDMEELKRFQGSTIDTFSRRNLIEDRDTILELTAKIQELQNEVNCMNDSRDFQDAESVRSGESHVTQSTCVFLTFSKSWRNAKPFSGNAEPQWWAAKYLGHAWYIGKRFCKSNGVFFSTLSARVQSLGLQCIRTQITTCDEWKPNTSSGSEMPVRTVSQKFIRPEWGKIFKELWGQTNNDCRFQILILTNSPRQQRSLVGRKRFKTEVCTCSQFPTEAMLWIKEVEMVESVDGLKSSCSLEELEHQILKYSMRRFLQHWTEPSRIPASRKRSVWRNRKPKKRTVSFEEDRSLAWSTSTSGSLEPMTLSRIVQTYLQLFFEVMIFRNSIQNGTKFFCRWHKSHLMTSGKDCTN